MLKYSKQNNWFSGFLIYVGVSIFTFSCTDCPKIKFVHLKVHTFSTDRIFTDRPFPEELKNLIQPITENCISISKIDFSDKINPDWKTNIDLERFSKENGGISIADNINTSGLLMKRFLDEADEHTPAGTHILYSSQLKKDIFSTIKFDYDKYYNEFSTDTSIGFFIWTEDKKIPSKNIYSELTDLRNGIAKFNKEFPWKAVVVAFKPRVLPGDLAEEEPDDSKVPAIDTLDLKPTGKKEPPSNNVDEICDNGKDDDEDGKVDCKDSECEPCKEKCLIIYSKRKSFYWTDLGPEWQYAYAFTAGDYKSGSKARITSIDLPPKLPHGVLLRLKVSAHNGPITKISEYEFNIDAADNYIIVPGYCPDSNAKRQNCISN